MVEEIKIQKEDDAWRSLELIELNEFDDTAVVTFEGWPNFKLTLQGKDFDSTIPTRVMPPILRLQKEIHRTYTRAVYNTDDTRRLTTAERERLEIVVSVKKGTSSYFADLGKILNEILKNSKMSGTETLIFLLGSGVIVGSYLGWRVWVASSERKHEKDSTVKLSQEETKRMEIFGKAIKGAPELENTQAGMDEFRDSLAKSLKQEDILKVSGEEIITGEQAAEIVTPPRETIKETRIDGEFLILEVKFPKKFGQPYRFKLESIDGDQKFYAFASPEVLSTEQIDILKDSGFAVELVKMEINAKIKHDKIDDANVVSITWPGREQQTEQE